MTSEQTTFVFLRS